VASPGSCTFEDEIDAMKALREYLGFKKIKVPSKEWSEDILAPTVAWLNKATNSARNSFQQLEDADDRNSLEFLKLVVLSPEMKQRDAAKEHARTVKMLAHQQRMEEMLLSLLKLNAC
jgi:hypothetical protein